MTSPAVLTVVTDGALELQVTGRPMRVPPAESRAVAARATVPPTRSDAEDGVTTTAATGTGVTVAVAAPVIPSTVAVMAAAPGATAVTTPAAFTVATAGVPELQLIVLPVTSAPAAVRGLAVSVWEPPTRSASDGGEITTLCTVGGVMPPPPPPGVVGVVPPSPPPPAHAALTRRAQMTASNGTRRVLTGRQPPRGR